MVMKLLCSLFFGVGVSAIIACIISGILLKIINPTTDDGDYKMIKYGVIITMVLGVSTAIYLEMDHSEEIKKLTNAHEKEINEVQVEAYNSGVDAQNRFYDAEIERINRAHEREIESVKIKAYEEGRADGFQDGKNTNPTVYETIIPRNFEEAYELGFEYGREVGVEWAIDEYNIDW